jgi:hypothetical protein
LTRRGHTAQVANYNRLGLIIASHISGLQNMGTRITATIFIFLLTACDNKPEISTADLSGVSSRVDSCDTRKLFGTCVAYTLAELDEWDVQYVESACPRNRRGDLSGEYKKNSDCPSENRVARCEGITDDPTEPYEYDKHYYAGTADGYSWKPADVQVTCEIVSGHFIQD